MESVSIDLALHVGALLGSALILVLGMKYAVNGLRSDVSEIKGDLKTLLKSDAKQNERLSASETEADAASAWKAETVRSGAGVRELGGGDIRHSGEGDVHDGYIDAVRRAVTRCPMQALRIEE